MFSLCVTLITHDGRQVGKGLARAGLAGERGSGMLAVNKYCDNVCAYFEVRNAKALAKLNPNLFVYCHVY